MPVEHRTASPEVHPGACLASSPGGNVGRPSAYQSRVAPQAHAWLAAAAATVAATVVAAVTAIVSAATATTAVAEQQDQDHDPPPVVIQTATETVIVTHKITSAIIFVEL